LIGNSIFRQGKGISDSDDGTRKSDPCSGCLGYNQAESYRNGKERR